MSWNKEVEVTISSAKDIKNVNWRHGPNKPYAVVWVDPRYKFSTRVDEEGDTSPSWNETLLIPLPPEKPVDDDDNVLCIDIVHAGREDDTKPLIGSARLCLRDVIEESGVGVPAVKTLKLKRPSGRPHGKLEVNVTVRESRYPAPGSYNAPSYGYSAPPAPPPAYGAPYAPQYAAPPSGYPYNSVTSAPAYGQQPGYAYAGETEKKGNRFGGMGTGLAVGAVAGALGGFALAEGVDALEDHIAEEAAEKVEDDLDAGDDFGDGDDDF